MSDLFHHHTKFSHTQKKGVGVWGLKPNKKKKKECTHQKRKGKQRKQNQNCWFNLDFFH